MPRVRAGRVTALPDFSIKTITKPSLGQIRQDILTLEDNIGDWLRPMQFSKQILIDDTKRAFFEEVDPRKGDTPWVPWSRDYAARVSHTTKLRKTGSLFRNATNPGNWLVSVKRGFGDIQLNTSRLPRYWTPHQFGNPPGYEGRADQEVAYLNALNKAAGTDEKKFARLRRKNPFIPKRGFIGGGQNAQNAIFVTFDEWANDAIRISHWRGSSGRLVKRVL